MSEFQNSPERQTKEYKLTPEFIGDGIVFSLAGVAEFDLYTHAEGQYTISGKSPELVDLVAKITPDHSLQIGRNNFGEDPMPSFEKSSRISRDHLTLSMDEENNVLVTDNSLNGVNFYK